MAAGLCTVAVTRPLHGPGDKLGQGQRSDRLGLPAVAPSTKLVVGFVGDRGAQHSLVNAAGVLHVTTRCSSVCDFGGGHERNRLRGRAAGTS